MGSMKTKMTNAAVGEERPEVLETARRAGSAPRSPGLGNEYEGTGVCAAALQDSRAAPGCARAPGLRGAGGRGTRVSKGPRASGGRGEGAAQHPFTQGPRASGRARHSQQLPPPVSSAGCRWPCSPSASPAP